MIDSYPDTSLGETVPNTDMSYTYPLNSRNRSGRTMNNFFYKLNEKLSNFMVGRNGTDKLARWCIIVAVALAVVNMIIPNIICSVISYALLFYCLYRIFSRNVSARSAENERFEDLLSKVRRTPGDTNAGSSGPSRSTAKPRANSATTVYFTCDECGQSLSVPKGKGTLKVTCPKCKHQTTIKS